MTELVIALCAAAIAEALTRTQCCTITVLDPTHRDYGRTFFYMVR